MRGVKLGCSTQEYQASKNCRYASKNFFFWSTERRLWQKFSRAEFPAIREIFCSKNFRCGGGGGGKKHFSVKENVLNK